MGVSLPLAVGLIRTLALRGVPSDLIFVDATARDAFFASNPDRVQSGITVVIGSGTANPELQLYQGATGQPYDNTQWQDITGVVQGPKGDPGQAGELSADNLLYVSASANPPIPIGDQDGTRTNPYSTIQRAIDNQGIGDEGVEIVDGGTYTEDITITSDIRVYAPNASLTGNVTTNGNILSINIQNITGTIDNKNNVRGLYTNNNITTLSTGASEFELITQLAKFQANLEIDEILYLGEIDNQNSWRVRRKSDGLLAFDRYEGSTWVEKQSIGGSVFSDIYYASGVAGGMRYDDSANNREVELIRLSPGGTIISYGDENLNTTIVSDDTPRAIVPTTGTPVTVDVNTVDTVAQAGTEFNFQFTSVNGGRIENVTIDTDGLSRVRIAITENVTGVTVYETSTLFDFQNNNAGVPVPSGRQTLTLERVARIQPNLLYDVVINVATSGTINGDNSSGSFVPYLQYSLLEVEFCELGLLERYRTIAANTTIDNSNYRVYRNNTILFNQDSASDVTLTITDGVFDDNDELTILFYPSADVNDGLINIQMGATGTINGQNSMMILRDSTVKIKHNTGDDWFIISNSEHPVSVRRDTPTVPMMMALTQASVNGNSALWFVANDQLLANEQSISNTIFIEALRDDLLDLNGNPIPTTATQKNVTPILLEAGTICRIFSSTPTQSIIRVVFTPERSSSQSRIETETTSTTITSANVAEYRNDLILFTNPTGIEDLIIQDDVFDVNDEITIKHYTGSPGMSTGVDITQQGSGADIDGSTTVQLRGNTTVKIKYLGGNVWRIISSSGMATSGGSPTTIVPDAHHFSINIPNRVTPSQSPDPVNGTRRVNFSVTNHDLITRIDLHIGASVFSMTVPTSDGDQFQDISVSGIDISSVSNQNMFIRLNNDSSLQSNIQVLRIANPVVHESMYYDIQASGQANTFNYQSATAQSQDILGSENTFNVPTFTGNMYLAIAQPATQTEFSDIFVNGFAQLGAFTKTDDAIQINSVNYDVWVSNNALVGSIVSGDTIRVVR